MATMTIETEQKPTVPRGANGLHDDLVALKVDVATIKEQCNHFAKKEDVAELGAELRDKISVVDGKIDKAKNELLDAVNRAALRVIVALAGVIVSLLGILVTLILK